MLDYLKGLGVTAVELLPVHQSLTNGILAGEGLTNYWGYDTIGFFSLHSAYSSARRAGDPPGSEIDEFKAMVKALHAADIEVILDVVFNHTAEGNETGPDPVLPGNRQRRLLPARPRPAAVLRQPHRHGNTIDAASPMVRRLIMDSLRYWVDEMHVDGFRFDLAAVLGSDEPGTAADADPGWDRNAAFFDLVLQDPTLARTKLIAEPWTRPATSRTSSRRGGRSGTASTATSCATSGAPRSRAPAGWAPGWRAARTCTPSTGARSASAASPRPRSTSSPATTASP